MDRLGAEIVISAKPRPIWAMPIAATALIGWIDASARLVSDHALHRRTDGPASPELRSGAGSHFSIEKAEYPSADARIHHCE